jgi:Uma2 family endonuclease
MPTLILDPAIEQRFTEQRSAAGLSERDEVWDRVKMIMPLPNIEHQQIVRHFMQAFEAACGSDESVILVAGANVSDLNEDWENNFREPDLVFARPGGHARNRGTHLQGGPDFLLEVVSPQDQCRDKLPFYASIGTREVLIVDRDPWQLELYQLRRNRLRRAGTARPGDGKTLASHVVPLTVALVRGRPRSKIRITHTETGQDWTF